MVDFELLPDDIIREINIHYYERYGKDLINPYLSIQKKNLNSFLTKNKIVNKEEEIENLLNFSIEYLTRHLKEIAMIEYLIMKKLKKFEKQINYIKMYFCRNLLKIPYNSDVYHFDFECFDSVINSFIENIGGDRSIREYRNFLKRKEVPFLGLDFINSYNLGNITAILDTLGLPISLYVGYTDNEINFIFGWCNIIKTGDFEVKIFEKEYIRSPHSISGNVGLSNSPGGYIIIRKETCRETFYNIWDIFFNMAYSENKRKILLVDIYNGKIIKYLKGKKKNRSHLVWYNLAKKILSLYNLKTREQVLMLENIFVSEIIDETIWHEIGHRITRRNIGKIFPFRYVSVLTECLADWALKKGKNMGTFAYFLEVAESDKNKATRYFLNYILKIWSREKGNNMEVELGFRISIALVLQFVKDGGFDFEKMKNEHKKVYNFVNRRFNTIVRTTIDMVKNANFKIGEYVIDFNELVEIMFKMYNKEEKFFKDKKELLGNWPVWNNIRRYLKKFSPETFIKIDSYLRDQLKKFKFDVLKMISENKPQKYNNSLNEYIYEKCKELGVLE